MPISELIARGSVLAPLAVSGLYVAGSQLRTRVRRRREQSALGLAAQRAALAAAGVSSLAEWHRLPTEVQAAADEAALSDAKDAARAVADRAALEAARVNVLYHP